MLPYEISEKIKNYKIKIFIIMEVFKMTLEKVINLIAEHLDMDESEITEDSTFEDLGIDSLDAVEIMMETEDEFGIEITPADAGKSVKELVEYIDSKLA